MRGLCADRAGDMQLLAEIARNHVARADQRIDRRCRLTLGHLVHGFPGIFHLKHLHLRVVMQHKLTQHSAPHHGHPLTRHLVQGGRAARPDPRDKHEGRGEIRPGKAQLPFTGVAGRESAHQVGFARGHQRDQFLDRIPRHRLEYQPGSSTDIEQHIRAHAFEGALLINKRQRQVMVIDGHFQSRVFIQPALFVTAEV